MSRSVTMPISLSFSPIGIAPISCSRINFASSVIGVSGPTQSTPLCIASLTFMVDLLCGIMCAHRNAERVDSSLWVQQRGSVLHERAVGDLLAHLLLVEERHFFDFTGLGVLDDMIIRGIEAESECLTDDARSRALARDHPV